MPFTEKTIVELTSDLTGRTEEVTGTPEPYKWPAAKDMPKLYVLADEAEALTAFLSGNPEPLKALLTPEPASNGSGSKVKDPLLNVIRVWARSAGKEVKGTARVPNDVMIEYFKANADAVPGEKSSERTREIHAKAHAAS
jgi:hypothetical protein